MVVMTLKGSTRMPLCVPFYATSLRVLLHSRLAFGQDENYDLLATDLPDGEAPGEGEQANGYGGTNGTETQEPQNGEASQPAQAGAGMQGERQPNKVRVTTPYLTKYERARVLGTRALQIRCVARPCRCLRFVRSEPSVAVFQYERAGARPTGRRNGRPSDRH